MDQDRNTALLRRPVAAALGAVVPLMVVLGACTSDNEPSDDTKSSTSTATAPNPGESTGAGPTSSQAGPVTADEAGTIATQAYGGTVKNVEADSYQGTPAWEVEIKDSDQGRIEVKVAQDTGEILDVEHED